MRLGEHHLAAGAGDPAPAPAAVWRGARRGLLRPLATAAVLGGAGSRLARSRPAVAQEAVPDGPGADGLGADETPRRPLVALTFDAGSDRGYAASILDLLVEGGIPASFGITGLWAQANPALVVRAGAEGHLLLNHTLSHRSFTGVSDRRGGLSADARRAELLGADDILAPLLGQTTRPWYRLPYGDSDARVAADVAPSGYTRHAGWTVDSLGWRGLSAAEIVFRCLRLAAPGAVYLFHVGSAARDGPALGAIVDGLRQRGFDFATMATLEGPGPGAQGRDPRPSLQPAPA